MSIEEFEPRLQREAPGIAYRKASSRTTLIGESPSRQHSRGNGICSKPPPTRVLDNWNPQCVATNQVKVCEMST